MTALDHITAGRIALRALLITVVVTAGIAGTAVAEPMDGKGNDPYPEGVYLSLDGKGNDVYPPPGVYASRMAGVIDGKWNDAAIRAFPINNFTVFAATYVGRGGGSGKPSF